MSVTSLDERETLELDALIVVPEASTIGRSQVHLFGVRPEPQEIIHEVESSTGGMMADKFLQSNMLWSSDALRSAIEPDEQFLSSYALNAMGEVFLTYLAAAVGPSPALHRELHIVWPHVPQAESATDSSDKPTEVIRLMQEAFDLSIEETFEDGVQGDFSTKLMGMIEQFGSIAISAMEQIARRDNKHIEASAEALRWIGLIDNPPTHNHRLRLLMKSLDSKWPAMRDAAILGISYLDDPKAKDALVRAMEQEPIPSLRDDIESVIKQLE